MIVCEKHRGTSMHGHIDDDPAKGEIDPARVAAVAGKMDAARLFIEMRDPQHLPCRVLLGEAAGKELMRRRRSIELQRKFGTLILHPLALTKVRSASDWKRVGFGRQVSPF
jgi:hypothetical protein